MTRDRARRFVAHRPQRIRPSQRALWNLRSPASQVFFKICPRRNIGIGFIIFYCPFLYGRVNHAEIIDARVFRALAIAAGEIGYDNGDEHCNPRKYNCHFQNRARLFHSKFNTAQLLRLRAMDATHDKTVIPRSRQIHVKLFHCVETEVKPNMKIKYLIGITLTAVALAGCATEEHEKESKEAKQAKYMAEAKVSQADAQATAMAQAPNGTVRESELEKEHGKLIWSFDIATPGTTDITEVNIDALTGKVASIEKEKAEDEAKEAKKDKD